MKLRMLAAASLLCITCWCGAQNAENETQIDSLLRQMTLEEKLLQLLSYAPDGVPRPGIPNMQAGEVLHGVVGAGTTPFPQSIALGATWDPALMEQVDAVIAQEACAVGIHQGVGPMLGLARDQRWGCVEESYGEDPYLVSRLRPGESRIVSFPLGFEQLKFWKDHGWVDEPGDVTLYAGSASDHLDQNITLHLAGNQ